MLFRQLFDPASGTFTYLIATDYNGEALIIDPVLEQTPVYEKLLNELGLTLLYAIDTHTHADHVTASGTLRNKVNCKIVMGKTTKTKGVDLLLDDGDTLSLGDLTFKAIYTPGHTADAYSLFGEGMLFTGDALLIRGTGRTDFPSGSNSQAYDSLFNKLLTLPEETLLYPGHDYKVITVSTLGEEKRLNPRLQVKNEKEYAQIMNNLKLEPPKQFERAMELNPTCGLAKQGE